MSRVFIVEFPGKRWKEPKLLYGKCFTLEDDAVLAAKKEVNIPASIKGHVARLPVSPTDRRFNAVRYGLVQVNAELFRVRAIEVR